MNEVNNIEQSLYSNLTQHNATGGLQMGLTYLLTIVYYSILCNKTSSGSEVFNSV